jgi:hypothetical protein
MCGLEESGDFRHDPLGVGAPAFHRSGGTASVRPTQETRAWIRLAAHHLHGLLLFAMILLIRTYQAFVRPFLIGSCKFHPTCSEYAVSALQIHGPFRGGLAAARRLLRCHPFSPGGLDPVPPGGHTHADPE